MSVFINLIMCHTRHKVHTPPVYAEFAVTPAFYYETIESLWIDLPKSIKE